MCTLINQSGRTDRATGGQDDTSGGTAARVVVAVIVPAPGLAILGHFRP